MVLGSIVRQQQVVARLGTRSVRGLISYGTIGEVMIYEATWHVAAGGQVLLRRVRARRVSQRVSPINRIQCESIPIAQLLSKISTRHLPGLISYTPRHQPHHLPHDLLPLDLLITVVILPQQPVPLHQVHGKILLSSIELGEHGERRLAVGQNTLDCENEGIGCLSGSASRRCHSLKADQHRSSKVEDMLTSVITGARRRPSTSTTSLGSLSIHIPIAFKPNR